MLVVLIVNLKLACKLGYNCLNPCTNFDSRWIDSNKVIKTEVHEVWELHNTELCMICTQPCHSLAQHPQKRNQLEVISSASILSFAGNILRWFKALILQTAWLQLRSKNSGHCIDDGAQTNCMTCCFGYWDSWYLIASRCWEVSTKIISLTSFLSSSSSPTFSNGASKTSSLRFEVFIICYSSTSRKYTVHLRRAKKIFKYVLVQWKSHELTLAVKKWVEVQVER